jgi:hypothetical protein
MRKYLAYSFLAILFFCSCSKEHKAPLPVTPGGKAYKIQFNLSGFTQTTNTISGNRHLNNLKTASADSSNTDSLDILYYLVYDSAGKLVHQITQHSDSASFAGFSDSLPAGNYKAYFFAGKTGLYVDTVNARIYYSAPGDSLGTWHDTFAARAVELNVTGNSSQNITLSRTVSALRINIKDAIPANAVKVVTSIQSDFVYYNYLVRGGRNLSDAYVKTLTTLITPALIGTTNLQQYTILAGSNGSITSVSITCYDASNNIIANAYIGNADLKPNQESILSGNLFGATDPATPFQISVNNTWNPVPHIIIPF